MLQKPVANTIERDLPPKQCIKTLLFDPFDLDDDDDDEEEVVDVEGLK